MLDFTVIFLEREYGIQRFEWESCGYEQQISPGKNSLHIPFYQTNTSQYCPLGAVCETGERGRQKLAKKMPGILYGICTFVSGTFAYDRAV